MRRRPLISAETLSPDDVPGLALVPLPSEEDPVSIIPKSIPAPPPPPPPPEPGAPKPPTPPREKTVIEIVRAQRIRLRQLKFAPRQQEKRESEKSPAEKLGVKPAEELAIRRRTRLFEDYVQHREEYLALLRDLVRTDFSSVTSASELGRLLVTVVEKIVKPLNSFEPDISQLVYYVDGEEYESGTATAWPLRKSTVAEVYRSLQNRFRSIVEDIESLAAHISTSTKQSWEALDSRYIALDARVKQLVAERSNSGEVSLKVTVDSIPLDFSGQPILAQSGALPESEFQQKATALGQSVKLYAVEVSTETVSLAAALRSLQVSADVVAEFTGRLERAAVALQKRFELLYFRKVAEMMRDLWNDYLRAKERGSSVRLLESKFITMLNAAFLFAGKRIGVDRRLEQRFEESQVGGYISAVLKKVLDELGTPERPGPRADIDIDRVSVDASLDHIDVNFCDSCATHTDEYFVCASCELAYYCSSECQKSDWDVHRPRCRYYSE